MSAVQAFRKGHRRFWFAALAVVLLIVLLTPKAGAATTEPVFEQKVNANGAWVKHKQVKPGEAVSFLLAYHNHTNHSQRIVLKDAIPTDASLLPGTTYLYNPASPNGAKQPNTVTTVGLDSGLLKPTETAFAVLSVTAPPASKLACGDTLLAARGSALVMGTTTTYTSNARITVHKDCVTPHYSCDAVTFAVGPNRKVSATSFKYTATGGATFKSTSVNWGDGTGTHPVRTVGDDTHTYTQDGTYTIKVVVHFTVNDQDVTSKCFTTVHVVTPAATPTPVTTTPTPTTPATTPSQPTHAVQGAQTTAATTTPKQPTTLVNTGASSVWGIALAAVFAGTAFRYVLLRRASRR
jgi:hypothetical protein